MLAAVKSESGKLWGAIILCSTALCLTVVNVALGAYGLPTDPTLRGAVVSLLAAAIALLGIQLRNGST